MQQDSVVSVCKISQNILCSSWQPLVSVTEEAIQEELEQRLAIYPEAHGLIVKLHGISSISDDAWTIISGKAMHESTLALALVFDKNAGYFEYSKIMADMRFSISPLIKYPFKYFDDYDAALNWMQQKIK